MLINRCSPAFGGGTPILIRQSGNKENEIIDLISGSLDADKRQISRWAAQFCNGGGIKGLIPKVGGRIRENMSFEEEAILLEQFKAKAEKVVDRLCDTICFLSNDTIKSITQNHVIADFTSQIGTGLQVCQNIFMYCHSYM